LRRRGNGNKARKKAEPGGDTGAGKERRPRRPEMEETKTEKRRAGEVGNGAKRNGKRNGNYGKLPRLWGKS